MRSPSSFRIRGAACALALALAAARPAHALNLSATIGGTGGIGGDVTSGGFSFSAAALWPFADRLVAGFAGFADDFGSEVVEGTSVAEPLHRAAYGLAWRADVLFRAGRWQPYGSGTWGFYYLRDDQLGTTRRTWGSIGASLGAGLRHPLRGRSTIGAEARYQRLFNDSTPHYMSFAMEWGWR